MANSRHIRKKSQRQEKRAAEEIGGRVTANSGAAKFSGGADVRKQGEIRLECKFTKKNYWTLKLADLQKLQKEALQGGMEEPVFLLEFQNSPSVAFAIRPHIPHAYSNWDQVVAHTSKGSVRLYKSEVQSILLRHNEAYVGFQIGPKGGGILWFDIVLWSSYLKKLTSGEQND